MARVEAAADRDLLRALFALSDLPTDEGAKELLSSGRPHPVGSRWPALAQIPPINPPDFEIESAMAREERYAGPVAYLMCQLGRVFERAPRRYM